MTHNLDEIIEKYYAGETSLAEEKWLKNKLLSQADSTPVTEEVTAVLTASMMNKNRVKTSGISWRRCGVAAAVLALVLPACMGLFGIVESGECRVIYADGHVNTDPEFVTTQVESQLALVSKISEQESGEVDNEISMILENI